jgi:hypothetical protein
MRAFCNTGGASGPAYCRRESRPERLQDAPCFSVAGVGHAPEGPAIGWTAGVTAMSPVSRGHSYRARFEGVGAPTLARVLFL